MRTYIITTLIYLLPVLAIAQKPSFFDSIYDEENVIEAKLTTNLKSMVKNKFDQIYQDGVFQIFGQNGDSTTMDVQLRSRGNIRKEVCYYPPIKVKFPKKQFKYHKIKWVNICRNSDLFEQFLVKEYLGYKLLNIVSDKSFRVQLMKVEIKDSRGKQKSFTRYAFILENEDQLAERLGGRIYEPVILRDRSLNKEYMALFAYFEYMIGNTDWSFANMHNLKILADTASKSLIPIPYDFDYSGLVNATYAVPHETVPIESVIKRYNRCYCLTEENNEKMRLWFLEKKPEIIECCEKIPGLTDRTRTSVIRYMESFFKMLEKPKLTEYEFVKNCKPLKLK